MSVRSRGRVHPINARESFERAEEGKRRDPYLLGMRRAIGKRLLLGLLLALVATIAGWTLVPPQVGTDAATVYWYTH